MASWMLKTVILITAERSTQKAPLFDWSPKKKRKKTKYSEKVQSTSLFPFDFKKYVMNNNDNGDVFTFGSSNSNSGNLTMVWKQQKEKLVSMADVMAGLRRIREESAILGDWRPLKMDLKAVRPKSERVAAADLKMKWMGCKRRWKKCETTLVRIATEQN
ncbi:hypothetical protein KQX54_001211 [Cotesia glomerata]|uniref:Uncharacterized protein n=1 Tax=Cotesia glomerata TaxID=32391 RepID=A0AAV7IAB1_COTGL|nr:hypothetical protein KQX54_001211 [Cotesia glomerata]